MKILSFKKIIFAAFAISLYIYTDSAYCLPDPAKILSKCNKLNTYGLTSSNRPAGMIGCWRAISPRLRKMLPTNFSDQSSITNIYSRDLADPFYNVDGDPLGAYLIFDTNAAIYSCLINQNMRQDGYKSLINAALLNKLFNASGQPQNNIVGGNFKLSDDFKTLTLDPGSTAPSNKSAYSFVFVRDQSLSDTKTPEDLLIKYMMVTIAPYNYCTSGDAIF